jgi:crossover junction endonuclease MUS81
MKVIIDDRERDLMKDIGDSFSYESKRLDLGDIHICHPLEERPMCIIERKSMSDLEASITDGRYREQKGRLASSGIPIIYIVEDGTIKKHKEPMVKGAILNTQVRDRIPIVMSKGVSHTATLIGQLKRKETEYFDNKGVHIMETYTPLKSKKSKNASIDDIYVQQLTMINGVSKQMAEDIREKYASMKILILAFENCNTPEKLLIDIPNPRIGNVISERVFKTLCPDT